MTTGGGGTLMKKQRTGSHSRLSSDGGTLTEPPHQSPPPPLRRTPSHSRLSIPTSSAGGFNDAATSDALLRLIPDPDDHPSDPNPPTDEIQLHLHSAALRRSGFFAALLSRRWRQNNEPPENAPEIHQLTLTVPASIDAMSRYLKLLQLLYSDDIASSIDSVSNALDLLPIAVELLFEDCIKACVRFLEAVPWSEDEERGVLNLVPLLSDEEAKELLARVSVPKNDTSEEMLDGLILSAVHNHPNMAFAKAFVAKVLRDFSSREAVRRVLDRAFRKSLRAVKQSLEEYSSPDFRGDHYEMEAVQRLNLHTAMSNGKHLLWLVERMIELRVADAAVRAWSEQGSFTADLIRTFRDDAWRNIVPSLPAVVLRCTSKLANAVATGNILADRQVRMKLVRDWLPVLITCKDSVALMGPNHRSLYVELEDTFLRIISTLPLSDAQDLLQQCLSFSTRNIDDCPHLVDAFTTWFRRANRPPQPDFSER